jgi:acetoin utilization deacetylase AcuC-like enzyme
MIQIIYSDEFLNHKTGLLHPERPERLTAIMRALRDDPETSQLNCLLPTPVVEREADIMRILHKIHTPDYIKGVEALAKSGGGYIDGDTPVSPDSYDVSLLAISAWWDGVDQVLATDQPVFVIARPPGHHAESSRGMGQCGAHSPLCLGKTGNRTGGDP